MTENGGVVCVVGVAHDGGVLQYFLICRALLRGEAAVERGPWYARLNDYVAESLHHVGEYAACCEVEALCHTDTKVARPLVVEFEDCCPKKFIVGVVVGAVARKGYYVVSHIHGAKITKLRQW